MAEESEVADGRAKGAATSEDAQDLIEEHAVAWLIAFLRGKASLRVEPILEFAEVGEKAPGLAGGFSIRLGPIEG